MAAEPELHTGGKRKRSKIGVTCRRSSMAAKPELHMGSGGRARKFLMLSSNTGLQGDARNVATSHA